MSRLILVAVIAVLGVGAYLYLNQPEPTPAEKLESAAQQAGEAIGDAATAVTEAAEQALSEAGDQASDAASSVVDQATETAEQAGQAATDLANQTSDQVAALTAQGSELINTWVQEGMLTGDQFDYDKMVDQVRNSQLSQDIQTKVIAILDEIKVAPETAALKLQELRSLLIQ